MQLDKNKYIDATYEWCSMAGSYNIPCKIYGWDDKSERFYISYFDPVIGEVEYKQIPYTYVSDYTWQNLLAKFKQN